ncbi:unnamed protein product [Hydatigera taeniaeformis]|uniref:Ovule protein n=1 Tax=Hydatigena taeniaeformis TaxID=6205 RepID=A0A0R3X6I7_HYDTA|nr:unnamed protein product [Hydatigera taeniaeformis]
MHLQARVSCTNDNKRSGYHRVSAFNFIKKALQVLQANKSSSSSSSSPAYNNSKSQWNLAPAHCGTMPQVSADAVLLRCGVEEARQKRK